MSENRGSAAGSLWSCKSKAVCQSTPSQATADCVGGYGADEAGLATPVLGQEALLGDGLGHAEHGGEERCGGVAAAAAAGHALAGGGGRGEGGGGHGTRAGDGGTEVEGGELDPLGLAPRLPLALGRRLARLGRQRERREQQQQPARGAELGAFRPHVVGVFAGATCLGSGREEDEKWPRRVSHAGVRWWSQSPPRRRRRNG